MFSFGSLRPFCAESLVADWACSALPNFDLGFKVRAPDFTAGLARASRVKSEADGFYDYLESRGLPLSWMLGVSSCSAVDFIKTLFRPC